MKKLIAAIYCITLLSGCGGLVVIGAASVTALSATDRRTLGEQIDDVSIDAKISQAILSEQELYSQSRIKVISSNGQVLLIGQTPTQNMQQQAGVIAKSNLAVSVVFNQLRIAKPISLIQQGNDSLLTSKIKFALYQAKGLPIGKIKVVTENQEVFLMGLVTRQEAIIASEIASNIAGVKQVITAFQIIDN